MHAGNKYQVDHSTHTGNCTDPVLTLLSEKKGVMTTIITIYAKLYIVFLPTRVQDHRTARTHFHEIKLNKAKSLRP